MTCAAELLRSQMYAVGDVCQLCGFRDESHFSRAFKKHCGISPAAWAKEAAAYGG
ncbi:MAG: AraC family transcriptional regulator [Clostridia bacterium]|nr:AraC family transcriptional regulator [Clostridia bacterium]